MISLPPDALGRFLLAQLTLSPGSGQPTTAELAREVSLFGDIFTTDQWNGVFRRVASRLSALRQQGLVGSGRGFYGTEWGLTRPADPMIFHQRDQWLRLNPLAEG